LHIVARGPRPDDPEPAAELILATLERVALDLLTVQDEVMVELHQGPTAVQLPLAQRKGEPSRAAKAAMAPTTEALPKVRESEPLPWWACWRRG
jgi:hypothetical protein